LDYFQKNIIVSKPPYDAKMQRDATLQPKKHFQRLQAFTHPLKKAVRNECKFATLKEVHEQH